MHNFIGDFCDLFSLCESAWQKTKIVFSISVSIMAIAVLFILLKLNVLSRLIDFANNISTDASRPSMFILAYLDGGSSFFFGHGFSRFGEFLYENYGQNFVFHSTIGNFYYSSGFIGTFLWIFLIFLAFVPKKLMPQKGFFIFALICQILFDFSGQVSLFKPQVFSISFVYILKFSNFCPSSNLRNAHYFISASSFKI